MTDLAELRAREDEVAREWHWLHGTLNEIACVHADQGDLQAFRRLHEQVIAVGQRRLELSMQIAEIEGPPLTTR